MNTRYHPLAHYWRKAHTLATAISGGGPRHYTGLVYSAFEDAMCANCAQHRYYHCYVWGASTYRCLLTPTLFEAAASV